MFRNPKANTPAYDIALFTDKIPASLDTLQLDPEKLVSTRNLAAISPLFSNKVWLWDIMFVLMATMSWFTLKMIKRLSKTRKYKNKYIYERHPKI